MSVINGLVVGVPVELGVHFLYYLPMPLRNLITFILRVVPHLIKTNIP